MKIRKQKIIFMKYTRRLVRRALRVSKYALHRSKPSRLVRKYLKMEAGVVLIKLMRFIRAQIAVRPRLRLSFGVLLILLIILLASIEVSRQLAENRSDIKVRGHAVLVAQEHILDTTQSEVSSSVLAKLSPFVIVNPVEDALQSQRFSSYHRAVDLATSLGTPIKPIGKGIVEFAGFSQDGKGNIVIVDHGDGLKTLYAHMGKINVNTGNSVDSTVVLGEVGLTGRTTGAHLHLEVYDGSVAMDPVSVLP